MSFNTFKDYLNIAHSHYRPVITFEPKNLSERFAVGIELELEGVHNTPDLNRTFWECVPDGSLRNHGLEIRCANPLSGAKLEKAIADLDECLANMPYEISERCSTHIHLDVTDMNGQQLLNFLLLSSMFEHLLFRLFGNTRLSNTFCMAVDSGTTNYDNIVTFGRDPTVSGAVDITWSKYAGISLNRLRDLGTVEFRMFCPITTKESYTRVLEFLFALKREALSMETIQEIILYKKSHTLGDVFSRLFPNEGYSAEYDRLLERGVQVTNDLITSIELNEYISTQTMGLHQQINLLDNQIEELQRGV